MKRALFVIGVQNYFMNPLTKDLPEKIRRYVKKNKNKFELIIFTNFVNTPQSSVYRFLDWTECLTSPETDIVNELNSVLRYGIVVAKDVLSALKIPKIKNLLAEKRIEEIYLSGIDTDCCVLATAYDAFDEGYRVRLLEKICMTSTGKNLHNAAVSMFKKNVGSVIED